MPRDADMVCDALGIALTPRRPTPWRDVFGTAIHVFPPVLSRARSTPSRRRRNGCSRRAHIRQRHEPGRLVEEAADDNGFTPYFTVLTFSTRSAGLPQAPMFHRTAAAPALRRPNCFTLATWSPRHQGRSLSAVAALFAGANPRFASAHTRGA